MCHENTGTPFLMLHPKYSRLAMSTHGGSRLMIDMMHAVHKASHASHIYCNDWEDCCNGAVRVFTMLKFSPCVVGHAVSQVKVIKTLQFSSTFETTSHCIAHGRTVKALLGFHLDSIWAPLGPMGPIPFF